MGTDCDFVAAKSKRRKRPASRVYVALLIDFRGSLCFAETDFVD